MVEAALDLGNSKTYFGYSKKQLRTITIFGCANLFASTIYSLQAPFYPKEAEAKGATATEYGFVLGVFQLVMFIMSGVYGSIIGCVNPRLVFNLGITITATCATLFGFLQYIDDHVTFITLSFVLRILQGCGDAAFFTASFTIIATEFPDCVPTTFTTFETCWGLGLIVGPGLGGVLYELGGFILPFLFMGGCLFTVSILTCFLLPQPSRSCTKQHDTIIDVRDSDHKFGVFSVIRVPAVALAFLSVVISACSNGFLVATLESHLRENFGLTPWLTGLVFVIDGGTYAFSAPIWGQLCDKSRQPKIFTLVGALLTFTGFLIIGPAPFIPLPSVLWLTCLGLVIHGLGVGACYVSAFLQALKGSVNYGYPDSVSTYGLVSGLYMSSFALGSFIGPSVGGVLLDLCGFKMSTLFVLATQVFIVLITSICICTPNNKLRSKTTRKSNSHSENEALLSSELSSFFSSSIDSNSCNKDNDTKKKIQTSSSSYKSSDYGST